MKWWRLAAAVFFILSACASERGLVPVADLVLRGGAIVTGDPARPRVEALAARDGRIVALGDAEDVSATVGPGTRVLELSGATAYPGFIEAHGHFLGLGRALRRVDLRGAATWEDVVGLVRRAAAEARPGAWIVGWGWHQEKWARRPEPSVEGFPVNATLDAAGNGHPVLLKHAAGSHGGIANAEALERAGISAGTPDPPGGRIVRDAAGRPTGVLLESAFALAETAYERDLAARPQAEVDADLEDEMAAAAEECVRKGVTSFQDAGTTPALVARLRAAAEGGRLPLRLWVMLQAPGAELAAALPAARVVGAADGFFTVRAIKQEMDGALGSRTAWLLAPYADLPESSGLNTVPIPDIEAAARLAAAHDLQLCVHAIGDRAVRETLDLFERSGRGARWRIEHAQHVAAEDLPRFRALGAIASMQGVHCVSDGPWVPLRLGEQRARSESYLWRTLLDAGVMIANGTDTPVEDVDPIAGFRALVTRRMPNGEAFFPEQVMTREEALRAMTYAPAFAAFEEDEKGSLAVGKLADVTVLDTDLLTADEDALARARVVATVVGGRVVWEAPKTDR
jgi:predicted amidohydrolase YtcJ